MPPTTTIKKIMAQHMRSQAATGPSLSSTAPGTVTAGRTGATVELGTGREPPPFPLLMQAQRRCDVAKPCAPGEPGLPDLYRMQLAFDVVAPEIEKPAQFRKIRRSIEPLPNEALQQV